MNAGAYREQVTIEKCRYTGDEIGNQAPAWSVHYRGYAYVNNLSGTEYWKAAQTQAQDTVVFIMRYHPLLAVLNTREYRLLHRSREYNIASIDNVQYKNEIIKIRAAAKG